MNAVMITQMFAVNRCMGGRVKMTPKLMCAEEGESERAWRAAQRSERQRSCERHGLPEKPLPRDSSVMRRHRRRLQLTFGPMQRAGTSGAGQLPQ